MRSFKNMALGLVGAAAVATASDVHDLKTDSFPGFIKENPLVLAECKSANKPTSSFDPDHMLMYHLFSLRSMS